MYVSCEAYKKVNVRNDGYSYNVMLFFFRFVHRFIELEGLNCLLDFLENMDFETR